MKLISFKTNSIDRVRGGANILMICSATILVGEDKFDISLPVVVEQDNAESLDKAVKGFISKAFEFVQDIPTQNSKVEILTKVVNNLSQTSASKAITILKTSGKDSEIPAWLEPAQEIHENEINEVCSVLGIDSFDVKDKMSKAMALVLKKSLVAVLEEKN
jgi:hypothetical protein